ncbi:DNase I-like protein [Armillaria solidipes]|uniref:DNase I-like protein n=1 Tax=Armillaria solidipes TaxID=1076256 RepID=A0A2H3BSM0_9AGAR|nr:DNase I-like protein [Armillaria solidipes]
MKKRQISLLTLQETHLSEEYTRDVRTLYGRRLSIHFSSCEENPTGKSGVAVVLNKDLVKTDGVESIELIPGRAMLIRAQWHGDAIFTWLAIYAPNKETENKEMWETLTQMWDDRKLPKPDGMSGDFNFVEDALDRLPVHEDSRATVEAFKAFRKMLNLRDGWRTANPEKKDYSFAQMAGNFSRSRIDRIYVSNKVLENCDQWDISDPTLETDHRVVSVKMTSPKAPYVGKGRWMMPLHLLNNGKAIREVEVIVRTMARDVRSAAGNRNDAMNPQSVYAEGKKEIIRVLRRYGKRSIPVKQAKMENTERHQ